MTACGVYALDVFSVCVLARHHAETTGYPVFEYHNRALGKPGGFSIHIIDKVYICTNTYFISGYFPHMRCDMLCNATTQRRRKEAA